MLNGNKIVLRKRILDHKMITGFEKISGIKLPHPPQELPIEEHLQVTTWEMDMNNEKSVHRYKELLDLFDLPFKTNGSSRLYFVMKRYCWWDVLFEVYEMDSK